MTGYELIKQYESLDALPWSEGGVDGESATLKLLKSLPPETKASKDLPAVVERANFAIIDGRGVLRAKIIGEVRALALASKT